jgi:isoleucyl-tRNA synthetase
MDKEFMESVWWAFKELYDKGKIYEGEKVLLYCTRDATPISKAEVAMDNSYQDVTDPSVYVKFKLKGKELYLLAWTTTPWTLNANTAIAVNKDVVYSEVELDGTRLIIAEKLLDTVLTDEKHKILEYKVLRTIKGKELVGLEYEPLFADRGKNAHKIWHADFVNDESGTGIAHEAPAYGEDDYLLAKPSGFPIVLDTDEEGFYTEGPWKGFQIWEHNKQIAKDLLEQGVVWKIEYIRHEYPHCHRCGTKLQYRAHPSWFMDIEGQRSEMLEQNGEVNWVPKHIKRGRSEKTIQSAPDWNISRDRFWATAMPVWKAKDKNGTEHVKVVGSYAELKELSGVELEDYHRPWIDGITFEIDGLQYSRIDKVMDCWFESGSMPFAQFHYPFENVEKFEANFPGDFIVEYVPQVRAWFYYMNAVNVGLFGKVPFKTALVHGTMAGNDGRKMSKSFGNYTDPNELMDTYSADSLRLLLLSSPLLNGEDYSLQDKDVSDVARKLSMIWNMYDFFTLYAEADGWEYNGKISDPSASVTNPLDVWILSRLHELMAEVDEHMQVYDLPNAVEPILPFIDDASNWYVRRSRKRFWKSDNDTDKDDAYKTLHYVLVQLSMVLAPFTPFLAEELYQKLTSGESVHLLDWPVAGHVNELAVQEMATVRTAISEGLNLRASAAIKVRQPLASVSIPGKVSNELAAIVAEELNVKAVKQEAKEVSIDTVITHELKLEGIAREVIRQVQDARKKAGLDVDDRIQLAVASEDKDIKAALEQFRVVIFDETLATSVLASEALFEAPSQLNGADVTVKLAKA